MARAKWIAGLGLLLGLAAFWPAQAQEVDLCNTRLEYYDTALQVPEGDNRTVAKVYVPGQRNVESFRGNAVVIDGALGLLLTPRHVGVEAVQRSGTLSALGAKIDLVFRDFEAGYDRETTATIIALLGEKDLDEKVPTENQARDLALLRVDDINLRSMMRERRLAIGPHQRSYRRAMVETFFANSSALITDGGDYAPGTFPDTSQDMLCTYQFTYDTRGGDSGAPLTDLDRKSLTLGIILDKRPDAQKAFGLVLPASCLRKPLVDWMTEHFQDEIDTTVSLLMEAPIHDLARALRTLDGSNRHTNVRLHAAIAQIVDADAGEREAWSTNAETDHDRRFACVINTALRAREAKLPYNDERLALRMWQDLAVSQAEAISRQKAEAGGGVQRSGADAVLQRSESLLDTDPDRARELAVLASMIYANDLGLDYALDAVALDRPPEFLVNGVGLQTALETSEGPELARRFKGLSDSLMVASGLLDETEARQSALASARGAALQAVWLALKEAPAISSNALIAYSDASANLGDWSAAVEGYATAVELPGLPPTVGDRALIELGYVAGRSENVATITDPDTLRIIIEEKSAPNRLLLGGQTGDGTMPLVDFPGLGGREHMLQPLINESIGNFR